MTHLRSSSGCAGHYVQKGRLAFIDKSYEHEGETILDAFVFIKDTLRICKIDDEWILQALSRQYRQLNLKRATTLGPVMDYLADTLPAEFRRVCLLNNSCKRKLYDYRHIR